MTLLGDRLFGDDIGGNRAVVEQVRAATAARSDAVPFLLVPVRLETRFARTDVPAVASTGPSPVQRLIYTATATAQQLNARQYGTALPVHTMARRQFKRTVEQPLMDAAAADLDTLASTLAEIEAQLQSAHPADLFVAPAVVDALTKLGALVGAAESSIAELRSAFHRSQLLARLQEVTAHLSAASTMAAVKTVPAGELLDNLSGDVGVPRRRLVDSGVAYAALTFELGELEDLATTLTKGASDPVTVHRLYQEAGVEVRLDRALQQLASIAVLPEARQQELAARVDRLQVSLSAAIDLLQVAPVIHREMLNRLPIAVSALRTDLTAAAGGGAAQLTQTVDVLQVRIFPDDFALLAHEPRLSDGEAAAGSAYWQESSAAGGDDTARRAAWRSLAAKYGPSRAAWIVNASTPSTLTGADATVTAAIAALDTARKRLDEATVNPASKAASVLRSVDAAVTTVQQLSSLDSSADTRLRELVAVIDGKLGWLQVAAPGGDTIAAIARQRDLVAALATVPVAAAAPPPARTNPTRLGAWTVQPKAVGLPERFVVLTVSGNEISHVVAGRPIDTEGVALGPDPAAEEQPFTVNPDGSMTTDASMRWLFDYDAAAAAGMAVSVRITAGEAQHGFDRVYVIGIRAGDEVLDQQQLQTLLNNHHYTARGLALLANGTPTNSTEEAAAAYSSAENADRAFDVELGPAKVGSTGANPTDGWRLAQALGISESILDHIDGADGQNISEAQLAGVALWPGTAGYAVEELLGPVIGMDARDRLREFVTGAVIGRGSLPSFRVGPQPYGVLATTPYTKFVPDGGTGLPTGRSEAERQQRFDILLRDVLLLMHEDWTQARQTHVLHAFSQGTTDPQNHLLTLLGLDATSVSYAQRFAVNAGNRGTGVGPIHFKDPTSPTAGPFALLNRFATVFSAAHGIPLGLLQDKGQVTPAYRPVYDALDASRGFEVRYVDQPVALPGRLVSEDIGARLTAILQKSLETLGRDAATPASDQPLVLLLVRQALLVQARDTAARILEREGVISPQLRPLIGAGDLFAINRIGFRKNVTRWSFLQQELSVLHEALGKDWVPAGGALYPYLNGQSKRMNDLLAVRAENHLAAGYPGLVDHQQDLDMMRAHAGAIARLAAVTPSRLEEVTREHLDLCSHRLDPWISGLANRRLQVMRRKTPEGVHLGAFGWVENLKPAGKQLAPATNVPEVLDADPSTIIRHDPTNQGFIHAPSLGHAATAAILRSGYLAHGAASRMAVNLSSHRVRTALTLLDGISAGNDLGALLGYQFERELHDAFEADGIVLDDLILPLRRRFPSVVTTNASATPADEELRHVVDGYALLTLIQDWMRLHGGVGTGTLLAALRASNYAAYPYGLAGLIPTLAEKDRLDTLLAAIDRLADALDALGDLVVTEGVYQIVQGNQPRAAAALSALGIGRMPPVPEVVDTPVDGQRVVHRVLVQLPVDRGLPKGWTAASARADAEPTLNYWLGELLGPADMTWAQMVDADGNPVREVTMTALQVQPIDLLAMLHRGLDDALTELSARILDALRPVDVREGEPSPPLTLNLDRNPVWPAEVRSLADTAALLESVGFAVINGRSATSADYVLADTVSGAGAPPDTVELGHRAADAAAALQDLGVQLLWVLSDGVDTDPALLRGDVSRYVEKHAATYRGTAAAGEHLARLDALWLRREEFRSALLGALGFGISGVRLPVVWSTRDQVAQELLEAAEAALVQVAVRTQEVAGHLAEPDAPTVAGLRRALAIVFTESLPVLPRFTLSNSAELSPLASAPSGGQVSVQRWLAGVMAVREPVSALGTAISLADAFSTAVPDAVAMQLPSRTGEPWVGENGPTGPGDRLSLVIFRAEHLPLDGSAGVALLVDQWTELVPAAELTTGVSFHYDQPDSQPPQTLLLAVPPQMRGGWLWEDLVQTLHDTLELAKNRAVEPAHLEDTIYGPLLPALIGDIPPFGPRGGLSDHRIVLDFGAMQSGDA